MNRFSGMGSDDQQPIIEFSLAFGFLHLSASFVVGVGGFGSGEGDGQRLGLG